MFIITKQQKQHMLAQSLLGQYCGKKKNVV